MSKPAGNCTCHVHEVPSGPPACVPAPDCPEHGPGMGAPVIAGGRDRLARLAAYGPCEVCGAARDVTSRDGMLTLFCPACGAVAT